MAPGPHQELELKAVIPDWTSLRQRLIAAGAALLFRGVMQDRRYDRDDELSRVDQVLRTRRLVSLEGVTELILGWKGAARISPGGYKLREELEYRITNDVDPESLLLALGYTQIFAIDRWIETWSLSGATLRLERYPVMDPLLEVEGEPVGIERAIGVTGIDRSHFRTDSLSEFVARYEKRTGRAAVVCGEIIGSEP